MRELHVVSVNVDAVVVGEEREHVRVEHLLCPSPRFHVSCADVVSVKLHDLWVVDEKAGFEGRKVDRVDEFVVDVLQPSPGQVVLLGVVQHPRVQAFRARAIHFTVEEAKDGVELLSLDEGVEIRADH